MAIGRKAAWDDDGTETPESVKAFLARMVRPVPKRHWRSLWHRAVTDRQGSPGRAIRRVQMKMRTPLAKTRHPLRIADPRKRWFRLRQVFSDCPAWRRTWSRCLHREG